MVHGYHIVLCSYGSWLPNDPRGSSSQYVGKKELTEFGQSTHCKERRLLKDLTAIELRQRKLARRNLDFPPVQFSGQQALAIGTGFANAVRRSGYTIWACAILPEHTHLVIARHRYPAEQIANLLKGAATKQMRRENLHPLERFAENGERPPGMWSEDQWIGYLETESAIDNAIEYTEMNPEGLGKPRQHWSFVVPFAGLDVGWTTYH